LLELFGDLRTLRGRHDLSRFVQRERLAQRLDRFGGPAGFEQGGAELALRFGAGARVRPFAEDGQRL
jgi:hypothetical protein